MKSVWALLACGIGVGCGSSSRDRNLYEGTETLQEIRSADSAPVQDEVRSLPFKHVEWEYKLNRHQIRRMSMAGNHLYAETPTHEVIAFDRFAGEVKWMYKVDTDTDPDFPPVVADGVPEKIRALEKDLFEINRKIEDVLKEKGPGEETQKLQNERAKKREDLREAQFGDNTYVVSRQTLYCLDRESGYLRWSRRLDFAPSAQPFATQFYIFLPSAEKSRVYALSVKDKGSVVDYFRADIESPENHVTSRPVFEDPVLYFVSHDGNLYSYREWRRGNTFRTGGPIKADPIVFRHVRKVVEVDKEDPNKKTVSERKTKILFVGSLDNAFYAVDTDSGQLLWKYECGGPIQSAAVAKDLTVYVKTEEGALFALNIFPVHIATDGSVLGPRRNGELRWKVPLGERFLLKGKRGVYILGPRGEIYAMEEATGDIHGRYPTKTLQFFLTNTADDLFYCATSGGHVFALRESKENY